jgi:hypothetical protein
VVAADKLLVGDGDLVVRSKASGQLARLLQPPPKLAAAPPPPPVDDNLPNVKLAFDAATATANDAKTTLASFDALARELSRNLDDAAAKVEAAADSAEVAARAVSEAAGTSPSSAAAKLIADATALARTATVTATDASPVGHQNPTLVLSGDGVPLPNGDKLSGRGNAVVVATGSERCRSAGSTGGRDTHRAGEVLDV